MIGIDTIRIKLDNFTINNDSLITINADHNITGEDTSDKLFSLTDGTEIECKKAYYNDPLFNFEIIKGINGTNSFVHFSIPKTFNNESNLELISKENSYNTIKTIEKKLDQVGIKTDLLKGSISRLDICKNFITDNDYSEYDNILNHLEMKRASKKDLGKNVNTHLWKNTLNEICIYDKFQEMKFKNLDVKEVNTNTVRCEIRLMKSRKVNSVFNFKNTEDLFDKYNEIEKYYKKNLKDNIFKHSLSEFDIILRNDVVTRLNYFKSHYNRNSVNEFIKAFGINQIDNLIGINNFNIALKQSGCKKNTIHYIKKNYNKKLFENSLFTNKLNPVVLYNELKYKLTA